MTPVELALGRMIGAMHEAGIPILGLRGVHEAPLYRHGGDLDLACSPGSVRRVEASLRSSAKHEGAVIAAVHRTRSMVQIQMYAEGGPTGMHHLCVDIHTRETTYGIPFLSGDELVAGRNERLYPERPSAVLGSLLNFLTPYLSGGRINPEYVARLEVVLEKHPAELRATLGRIAGTVAADRLIAGLRSRSESDLARHARSFRRALIFRRFAKAPLESARGLSSCLWANRIAPWFKPRGLVVALLGTDGTGKTTLGEALHKELRPAYRSTLNRTIKLRPGLLPQLGRFAGRKPTLAEYEHPHRARPSGLLGTWLRASYYFVDYTVGYLFKVLPLRRRHTLILFDRWIDDWLVDPARYRLRAGSRYVRFLTRLAPRPDAVLVTTASMRTVRSRKQEVSPRETLRQLHAYECYAAASDRVFVVSTDGGIDQSIAAAHAAIFRGVDFPRLQGKKTSGATPLFEDARRAA